MIRTIVTLAIASNGDARKNFINDNSFVYIFYFCFALNINKMITKKVEKVEKEEEKEE